MSELCFHFVDGHGGTDARLAAAILSDCLSRQGYRSAPESDTVVVHTAQDSRQALEHVFFVFSEEQLADASLHSHMGGHSAVIVCSAKPAQTLYQELGRSGASVTTVDANGIAADAGADPVVVMLGGVARTVSLIDHQILGNSVWSAFDRGLPYAAQAAIRAFDQGYAQAQLDH